MAQKSPFRFTKQIDSLLWNLNKAGIDLLYTRVMPLALLHNFSDQDSSSASHFRQAAYELYAIGLSSAYNGPTVPNPGMGGSGPISTDQVPGYISPKLPEPDQLEKRQNSCAISSSAVPISLALYDFIILIPMQCVMV